MKKAANTVLIRNLMEFGLGEKEAKIYLALLELEIATVSEVAKTASINRSSAYVVLSSLKRKGLVNTSEDRKIQTYMAIAPEMLLQESRDRVVKTEKVMNKISDIVPELKALYKDTKQRPRIKIYEGKQGLVNAFEESLNSKEKIMRVSSSVKNISDVLPDYFPSYVARRIKLGIKMYGIHPYDETYKKIIEVVPKFDEPIPIPYKKYKFPADVAIYDDKIAYMSQEKNGLCILIESKEMADVMKSVFDLAYEEAKRLNKEMIKTKKQ